MEFIVEYESDAAEADQAEQESDALQQEEREGDREEDGNGWWNGEYWGNAGPRKKRSDRAYQALKAKKARLRLQKQRADWSPDKKSAAAKRSKLQQDQKQAARMGCSSAQEKIPTTANAGPTHRHLCHRRQHHRRPCCRHHHLLHRRLHQRRHQRRPCRHHLHRSHHPLARFPPAARSSTSSRLSTPST